MTVPYVTANCQGGACSACLFPVGCAHECHRDKAARAVEVVPAPSITVENPAFTALVAEQATTLCLGAPADSHSPAPTAPCRIHESEARRVLFGQWLGEQGAVA